MKRAIALALGSAFVAAVGCGSSTKARTEAQAEAGAAGAAEAGAPGAAGAPGEGGSAGSPSEAGAAGVGEGGTSGLGQGGTAGEPPLGEGGAPQCIAEGDVSNLKLNGSLSRQVCRGSIVQLSVSVDAAADFTCCAASSSVPSFGVTLPANYNDDGGGSMTFEVPANAPYGTHPMTIACDGSSLVDQLHLTIVEGTLPEVHSVNAYVTPTSKMLVKGLHLAGVTQVRAYRFDGNFYDCVFKPVEKTDTQILCDFGANIPLSMNPNDYFYLDVLSPCGYSDSPPPFLVVSQLPD